MKIEGMQGSFFIEYLCSCGLPVVLLGKERHFACVHCDSVCTEKECLDCIELMMHDSEAEGDEEDSDI